MIRRTRQRLAIEEAFQVEGRPLTPPEIFEHARRAYPRLGLRTVYRQLKDMSEEGLIVGLDYPGQPLRYEWVNERPHAHFICRRCDRVYDIDIDVPDLNIDVPGGFKVTGEETVFYGYCPDCADG